MRVFLFLLLDVLPDNSLVPPHGRHEIPARPEMLPHKLPLALPIHSSQVDRALSLIDPPPRRPRTWAGSRSTCGRGPPTDAPPRSDSPSDAPVAKHFAQVPAHLATQRSAPALRDENHVVLAVPHRVIQTRQCVHLDASSRVLGGSRAKYRRWTHSPKRQTATATPAEPAELLTD
jgi:hypothetical protein